MAAAMVAGAGTAATGATAGIAVATVVEAAGASTEIAWSGLELPTRGGEDCLTLGLKLCPPRVLIMAGLEMERMGGRKVSEMNWREWGGGGGGGGQG